MVTSIFRRVSNKEVMSRWRDGAGIDDVCLVVKRTDRQGMRHSKQITF